MSDQPPTEPTRLQTEAPPTEGNGSTGSTNGHPRPPGYSASPDPGAAPWIRGSGPYALADTAVAPGVVSTGVPEVRFKHGQTENPMRRLSPHARSIRVPAILVAVGMAPVLIAFAIMIFGLATSNRDDFSIQTNTARTETRSSCLRERATLLSASGAYAASFGRQATSVQQLLDARLLQDVPKNYSLTRDGSVRARDPGACSPRTSTTIPAITSSALGVAALLLYVGPLLQMWWLQRAFRSLPAGLRHFSAWWAFAPLACLAASIGLFVWLSHLTTNGGVIDQLFLGWLFALSSLAVFYAFCGVIRRVGTMYDTLGRHFAGTRAPGMVIRGFGLWAMMLVPWIAVGFLIGHASVPDWVRSIIGVLFVAWVLGLFLWQFASVIAALVGIALITPGQERVMREQAAVMTAERLESEQNRRATAQAMAVLANAPRQPR